MRKLHSLRSVALLLLLFSSGLAFSQSRMSTISNSASPGANPAAKSIKIKPQLVVQPTVPGPPPALGADILVNNNNGVTSTGKFTQSETSLVAFGNNVVIGFNDAGSIVESNKFSGFSYSTDGGATIIDGGTLPTNPKGDAGDPVLVRSSATGRIFYFALQFSGSGMQAFHSDDNGLTWSLPVESAPGKTGTQDKQWAAVDNFAGSGFGNVYMIERDFGAGSGIYFFRSTDNGNTFGPSGGVQIAANNQGAFVAVGPDHSVYAFWWTSTAVMMRRSTDQGLTFGAPIMVTPLVAGGTNGDLGLTGIRQGTASASGFRSSKFPHAAVNPVNGNIYVTYNNDPAGADKADVFLVQSTDNGFTWGAPVRINDDATTTDQWQPTIAVMPDGGQLGVFYYSRQEDPVNNNLFRYYGRIARISGATLTFDPSFAISDVASLPEFGRDDQINSVYMGDYNTAVTTTNYFHVVWSDNRDDLAGGSPRKDPNVYYQKIYSPLNIPGKNINVTPASVNFGDVGVGKTAGPFAVNITNIGDAALTISAISSPAGDFSLSGLPVLPLMLAPGGTTVINVSFAPASAGLQNSSFNITSDAVNTPTATVNLQGNGVPPPANDNCSDAITVSCGSSVSGNTTFATLDVVPVCNAISVTAPGIWYKIVGTGYPVTVSTCTGSFFDTKISVYGGSCGSLSCVDANDNSCGLQSSVTWPTTAGTNYYILVHGSGSSAGNFTLTVSCPAIINVTPSPLVINLPSATTGSGVLNIANIAPAGSQTLNWTSVNDVYQFKTSNMVGGPVFNWIDITGTGTLLSILDNEGAVEQEKPQGGIEIEEEEALGDDNDVIVPLPFSFPFFGQFKTSVRVASNGYLTFGTAGDVFTNTGIPNISQPNDLIAPFWDDLNPAIGGTVHYRSTPTQFIVQYTNIRRFGTTQPNTFEVILNSDGTILYQYLDMQGLVTSATVGIENQAGTSGLQIAFNSAFVQNNLAVLINQPNVCSWITSVSPAAGSNLPGVSTPVTVSVDGTGLLCGSTNNCMLTITNSSQNAPSLVIPVVLKIASDPCSIVSIPSNNIYTGGIPTNLYLGYGPQSTTLQVSAPACGAPYTYAWSGGTLSNYNTANPVFTATTPGNFTFTVLVTNPNGYSSSCNITIHVYDVRVPGSNGKKIYLCHRPPDNPANAQSLSISVNAVPDHLLSHPADRLGNCNLIVASPRTAMPAADDQKEMTQTGILARPNPNRGNFTVQLNNRKAGKVEIRIINPAGTIIERRSILVIGEGQSAEFTLKAPVAGLYYVQVIGADGIQSTKLVITH